MQSSAVILSFLIIICKGQQCIEEYPSREIDFIYDNLNDTDVIYLGDRSSKESCFEACVNFNFLCDKSSMNEVYRDGEIEWITIMANVPSRVVVKLCT